MKVKKIIKKLIYKERVASVDYIRYLRNKGIEIGDDVEIFNPKNTIIDEQYPWTIKIGNHVRITDGVIILTHDFSWSVIKNYQHRPGEVLGASGKVVIGDNVFIGMNAIITRNVMIGNDVIIGVGSVVTSDCESGYVYGGVPARKIMPLNIFIEKREKQQLQEARELALTYLEKFGKFPPQEVFSEYFLLFMTVEKAYKKDSFKKQMNVGQSFDLTSDFYKGKKPMFSSFEEFTKYCIEG